ncbi:hypothetical protein [Halorussus salinisoli]|uniref:hypothetical protein n=1 Tax=Halorussus salinisoli TaxID=2558242 RepID=UPI0010C2156A|nr:hypothetical protein [Halorussus salinisoli]
MDALLDATGENTKSKAIDRAADFYIEMAGDTTAVPKGAFVELMATAEQQRSVTSQEIAEILDTEELPVEAEMAWSIGGD